jgi:putative SOS response-associated peptidase YedK
MRNPDPKLTTDAKDQRMVVVLEPDAFDTWLESPTTMRRALIQ